MAGGSIRGITIEFDSNTSKLQKGIDKVKTESTGLQKQITQINKSLKFDSGNTELVAQKMELLQEAAAAAASEVQDLKQVQAQMDDANVEKSSEAYRKLEQEIAILESKTKGYQDTYKKAMDSAPVETLRRQQELLKEDISASDKEVKDLEAQMEKMKGAGVEETDAKYVALAQKIETAKAKNAALKQSLDDLGKNISVKEEEEAIEDLGDSMEETSEKAEEAGESMQTVSGGMDDVAAALAGAGLVQLTKEFAQALGDCVSTAASFDTAMSQVAATMGVSVDSISNMSEAAREMGSSTQFSATESAEALNYLALAGYDAEKAVDTLPTVLNLAAAGSMDLASASDMVTDAMSALGLQTSQADDFVDQMAKTASSSNTSVSQLGEALLTIGATGKTVAGGTQELNTELGLLANVGLKGSEAGTHLRNILLALQSPTDDAAAELDKLTTGVYDAEGNMRNLSDIFGEIKASMEGYTQAEKDAAIANIFNKTDLSSANALLDASGESWDNLAASISDSGGAAQKMADTQLDNLNGALTDLSSATEGLKIAIGDQFSPALEAAAEGATKLTSGLTDIIEDNGGLAVAATGAASALGLMVTAMTALTAAQKIYNALKASEQIANLLTPIGLVTTAVSALAAGITVAIGDWQKIQEVQEQSANKVTTAQQAYSETAESISANQEQISGLVSRLGELTSATSASAAEQAEAQSIVDQLNELVPDLGLSYDEATNAINMNTDAIIANARAAAAGEEIEALQEVINEAVTAQIKADEDLQAARDDLADAETEQANAEKDYLDALKRGDEDILTYREDLNDANAEVDTQRDYVERCQTAYDDYQKTIDDTAAQIEELSGTTEDATESTDDLADSQQEAADAAAEETEAEEKANESLKDIAKELQNASGSGDELMDLYDDLKKEYDDLEGAGDEWRRSIIEQQLANLKLTATTAQLTEQMPMVSKYASNMAQALVATGTSVDEFAGWYNEALSSLVSGFDELEVNSENSLQTWIDSMNQRTGIQTAWNSNLEALNQVVTGANEEFAAFADNDALRTAIQTIMDGGVEEYGQAASELAAAIKSGDTTTVQSIVDSVNAASTAALETARQQFKAENNLTDAALAEMLKSGAATIEGNKYVLTDAMENATSGAADGVSDASDVVTKATADMVNAAGEAFLSGDVSTAYTTGGSVLGQYIATGISEKQLAVTSAARKVLTTATSSAQSTANRQGKLLGKWFDQGMASGISSNSGLIRTAAANAVSDAIAAAYAAGDFGSPSKKTYQLGEWFSEGMANGITEAIPQVRQAAENMAAAATVSAESPTYAAAKQNAALVTNGLQETMLTVNSGTQASNASVVSAINTIRADIANLQTAMSGMGVYMNGKTLVGTIVNDMDYALGAKARRG